MTGSEWIIIAAIVAAIIGAALVALWLVRLALRWHRDGEDGE